MTDKNLPSVQGSAALAISRGDTLSPEQRALVKRTVAPGATDDELELFLGVAAASRLNPFAKELYFTKFGGKVVIMPGIDGLRRKAAESGEYAGQVGPYWCGQDGQWTEVWLKQEPPAACKVGVIRKGATEPTWAVVTWSEFSRRGQPGTQATWGDRPAHMLAVVAERHALRKACPRVDEILRQQGADASQNAEWIMAQAERLERSESLPLVEDDEVFDDEPVDAEVTEITDEPVSPEAEAPPTEAKTTKTNWTRTDAQKFADHLAKRTLSNVEARELLGLAGNAHWTEITALGTADAVIAMVDEALEKQLVAESSGQMERLM